ncbi:MAG: chemotaxis protein [Desulfuromusa sp.]|nr:chemotaxis protein [Desulfuromusa sp.]
MKFFRIQLLLLMILVFSTAVLRAGDDLSSFDDQVKRWAIECRTEVVDQFNLLLTSGQLSVPQLFDTFYIPIPKTDPQKFKTQYDDLSDGIVRPIVDKILGYNNRLVFVVIVDINGYLPTHNSRYSRPLTGNADENMKWNRTKRMFNDRTGLAAARNQKPYLLQRYSRDTGEIMSDLSVPIKIQNRHWGAVRIGYKQK